MPKSATESRRPEPSPFVDIAPWSDLSDRAVARELGATKKQHVDYFTRAVALERSGEHDRAVPPGRTRCVAGLATKGLLRCPRTATQDRQWCWQHDTEPSDSAPVPVRPSADELRYRPDGQVLGAVLELRDRVDQLAGLVNTVLARLERAEDRAAEPGTQALWTVPEAAGFLGVTPHSVYAMVGEGRIPFVRLGRNIRFRPADLDEWLAEKALGKNRRRRGSA